MIRTDDPSAGIQFCVGEEDQDDDARVHQPHDLFIEMSEFVSESGRLHESGESADQGWKETAR